MTENFDYCLFDLGGQLVSAGMSKNFQTFTDSFLQQVGRAVTADDVGDMAARLASSKTKSSLKERAQFTAMLAQPAFLAPECLPSFYDAATEGWEGKPVEADPIRAEDFGLLEAPDSLWETYLSIVSDAVAGKLDALSITQRTAEMTGLTGREFSARLIAAVGAYPGVQDASKKPLPGLITMEQLASEPPGSLAREFHDLILDNKFDLEVLDRDDLGLSALPAPLAFLNTRILQSHDLWHIIAGYETTALHEVAISAFQLAQFGHSYSAQFLPIPFGAAALGPRKGFRIVADTVFSAWRHGRETPPLMLIDWEEEWGRPAADLRDAFDIEPYDSPYRPDLIEKTEPLIKAIRLVTAPFRAIAGSFQRA